MSITKRFYKKTKKTCYQAEIYIRGTRVRTRTFKLRRDAVTWHEKEKTMLKGDPSELRKESSSHFFSDCVRLFKEEAFTSIQAPTRSYYESGFRYLINSPLYNVKMEYLNAKHIHMWISWLKKLPTTNNVSRKSFKTELKLLSTILNWYKNFVNEDFNVPITKKHREACFYKQVPQRRPDYFMKPETARAWLKAMKEKPELPIYIRLAIFMLLTGVRVSEACGICWDAVDLEEGVIRIIRIMRWDPKTRRPYLVEGTKTRSSLRLIMLPQELIQILKEIKAQGIKSPLVFTKDEGEALRYGTIQKVFNRGFKTLGLNWRSTHILRHTYATMALLATKDLFSVQASLGHRSSKMTERYAKVIALLSKDTAEKTSEIFNLLETKKSRSNFIKIPR